MYLKQTQKEDEDRMMKDQNHGLATPINMASSYNGYPYVLIFNQGTNYRIAPINK
jgi:hypothetical protein